MAQKVASILAEIGLDSSKFTGGLSGVLKGLSDIKGSLKDISVTGPLAAAAILGLGKAAADAIKDTVAYAKQVEDLSRLIGATPEEASRMIQAADDMRISYETLAASMEAAIRKGFDPSIEGLQKLQQQYQNIQSPIERSKFLMDTFGRAGADMAPLLQLSSERLAELAAEADKAGLTMSGANLQAAKDYALAMDGLDDAVTGAKVQMANGLIPALTWFIENGVKVQQSVDNQNLAWLKLLPVVDGVRLAFMWIVQAYESLTDKSAVSVNNIQGTTEQMKYAEDQAKKLASAINSIPSLKTININTYHNDIYGGGFEYKPPPKTNYPPPFANGADFIVPAGYPNDSFQMRVQSGEHVKVTPAGETDTGSTPVFYGPVTFVVKNETNLSEIMQSMARV
jgi:hypothetical protein